MIGPISSVELQARIAGDFPSAPCEFGGVSLDSRKVCAGDVFVALKGERTDGHAYVATALAAGAAVAIVEQFVDGVPRDRQIRVDSASAALAQLARINRERFSGKIVGITGSSGKTTAKTMLRTVLEHYAPTLATAGNQNNELGVPLTLLKLESAHQYAVIEMGARKMGDIAYLGSLVCPDVAILLNAGSAHIEIFGSRENIVKGKGEIYQSLPVDGVAILNLDQAGTAYWQALIGQRKVLSHSLCKPEADLVARNIVVSPEGSDFELNYLGQVTQVSVSLPGKHNVENALAVIAAALALGVPLPNIVASLAQCTPEGGRLTPQLASNGLRVLDDTYNANPASMSAALDVLSLFSGEQVAVLGQMAELGDHAETAHRELAQKLAQSTVSRVYLIGPYAQMMAESIGERAQAFANKRDLITRLKDDLRGSEIVLLKGSRAAAMEEVVSALLEQKI